MGGPPKQFMPKLLYRNIILLLIIVCTNNISAQQLGLDILGDRKKMDIPFEAKQGFLIVELRLQSFLPIRFLFDTGAEHTILFKKELTDILNIKYERTVRIIGADLSKSMVAHVARNTQLKVANSDPVERDILVLEKDFLHMEEITGQRIDGILGASFFRGLIIQINYSKSKITIYDPEYFKEPDTTKYTKLPIELFSYKPYINCNVKDENNNEKTVKLLIDTGAALGFLYHANTDETIQLPKQLIPGSLGKGLGGELLGFIGKTEQLDIGPFSFGQLLTHYQDLNDQIVDQTIVKRNGIIGNILLSRFDIYIDYIKHYVYLKAKKKFDSQLDYDKSGLIIYAVGVNLKQYFIKDVLPGSPADAAGLRSGDYLQSIGWLPLKFYNLSKITKKLSGKHGKKIKLKVKRGDKTLKFAFRLKDPFYKEKTDKPKK